MSAGAVYTFCEEQGRFFFRPRCAHFRLMRMVMLTVTAITAETVIIRVIIVSPIRPEGISPVCCKQAGDQFRDP